jgi:hypothetical protein
MIYSLYNRSNFLKSSRILGKNIEYRKVALDIFQSFDIKAKAEAYAF